jgi:hypothetical protein
MFDGNGSRARALALVDFSVEIRYYKHLTNPFRTLPKETPHAAPLR